MANAQAFEVLLKRSRIQFVAWMALHGLVFVVVLLATLPVGLSWLLTLLLLVSAWRLCWAYRRRCGAFCVKGLRYDAANTWWLDCWHQEESVPVSLRSYQATPLGLAVTWNLSTAFDQRPLQSVFGAVSGTLLGFKWCKRCNPCRLHVLFTRDQLPEGDYRWLKVLFSQSLKTSPT